MAAGPYGEYARSKSRRREGGNKCGKGNGPLDATKLAGALRLNPKTRKIGKQVGGSSDHQLNHTRSLRAVGFDV